MSFTPLPYVRLTGTTPGSVSGESVELAPFWPPGSSLNNQSATLDVRVVAAGTISGNLVVRSFVQRFSIQRSSGTTVIHGHDTQRMFGDAAGSTWTVAATVGVSPDRFSVTFTTGSTTVAATVTADIYYTVSAPTVPPPTPLVEWRTDFGLTMASGNNTWNSRIPANTYNMLSRDSHLLALLTAGDTPGTPWQNGLNGVGFPSHQAGYAESTGHEPFLTQTNPPLTGNDLTVYIVLDFHCFGNPPAPASTGPIGVFQIGQRDQANGFYAQFSISVDNSGSNIDLIDMDKFGATEYAHSFHVNAIGNSPYLIGPTLMVCQTSRNSGHNVIFGGVQLTPVVINIVGTVPSLNTDVMTVCGDEYHDFGSNLLIDMCGCTVGNVLVYNSYHNAGTISAVSSALHAIWGV